MAQLKDLIVSGAARILGKIYADSFVGDVEGLADKATADASNNTITSTYIKSLYFDSNKNLVATKGDNTDMSPVTVPYPTPASLGFGYAVCTTAAATVAKEITITGYELVSGGVVVVTFENDVPAAATLNVSNKGALPIYYNGAAIVTNIICAGAICTLMCDGTHYHLLTIDQYLNEATNEYGNSEEWTDDLGEE